MKKVLVKTIATSLVTVISSSLANGMPPSGSSGCTGFGQSFNSVSALHNFQNSSYLLNPHSLTMPALHNSSYSPSIYSPIVSNGCVRNPPWEDTFKKMEKMRQMRRALGIEEESVVITNSESDSNFDIFNTEIENPVSYVSSLYNKVLWNNEKDEGFVAFKEKDNKLVYVGGTLMPISSENDDSKELIGNYVQFVHDTVNLDRLIWSEDEKFTSKGKLVQVLKEKTDSNITKLRYNDTNFYIERISKSAPSYTTTKHVVYINYDNGSAMMIEKSMLEEKLPTANE